MLVERLGSGFWVLVGGLLALWGSLGWILLLLVAMAINMHPSAHRSQYYGIL